MGIRHIRPYLDALLVVIKGYFYNCPEILDELLLRSKQGGVKVNTKKLFLRFPETEHLRYMIFFWIHENILTHTDYKGHCLLLGWEFIHRDSKFLKMISQETCTHIRSNIKVDIQPAPLYAEVCRSKRLWRIESSRQDWCYINFPNVHIIFIRFIKTDNLWWIWII